jgi:hypothetical protein
MVVRFYNDLVSSVFKVLANNECVSAEVIVRDMRVDIYNGAPGAACGFTGSFGL